MIGASFSLIYILERKDNDLYYGIGYKTECGIEQIRNVIREAIPVRDLPKDKKQ